MRALKDISHPVHLLVIAFAVALLGFTLLSCSSSPKSEPKTPVGYLDGQNYEQAPVKANVGNIAGAGISVPFKTKERLTVIEGRVFQGQGLERSVVRGVQVELFKGEKSIAKSTTNEHGEFHFAEALPREIYRIIVTDSKWSGQIEIPLNTYEEKNLALIVKKK